MHAYKILHTDPYPDSPEFLQVQAAFNVLEPYLTIMNNGGTIQLSETANNTLTRAEFLPLLENMDKAMDYYVQIRGPYNG